MEYFLEEESLEIVRLFVGNGYDPLEANSSGKTLICVAIEHGHVSVAQYLVSLGVQLPPDSMDVMFEFLGQSTWTQRSVRTPMVRFLVDNGVDIHACTETGDSVFHIALESCFEDEALDIAKLLVGYGCDPLKANSSGKTSFHITIERGHISVARYLLSLGIPLPPDILVALDPLDFWSTARLVHFLAENGADVHACTETGDSLLHIALKSCFENDSLKIAKLLLTSYGYNPLKANSSGKTSFHIAVERGHIFVVRYLLSFGVSLPPDILITLDSWSKWKTAEMVRLLVENGADVHAYTETGDSVLQIALESLEIAKPPVDYGCNPSEVDSSRKTSLHIGIEWGHISVARYLLSLGVPLPPDLLATLDPQGIWRTVQMVRSLVENGANSIHARNALRDSVPHVVLESLRVFGACDLDEVLSVPHDLDAGREWIYFCRSFLLLSCILASIVDQQ